jgi:hypothetical protein
MATTTLAIGLLIGVPLGLLVGGAAWRRVAADLDVAQDLVVPVLALATLILLSVGIANILAVVPGRRAASRSPADLLHAE